jgi:hypothetical protein
MTIADVGSIAIRIAEIRIIESARVAAGPKHAIGITAVDVADIGVAAGRPILDLAQIMAGPREGGPWSTR